MSRKYSLKRYSSDSFHYLLRCQGLPCIFIRSRLFTARLFATTIVAILLCGVVSSQNYSIRVTNNTNLRASFSLESAIIETAPAGTTLQVVGSHSRWLRINRNGNDVWMADWVAYTRVEEGVPSQGQTASDIDNCCFVDRQCSSDQEWTDGYWAYQNGQCPAPAGSQTPTSSQPVSGVPAQIHNCCFVDRQCHTDQDWTDGYWAFQNNQCRAPGQSPASASSQPASERIIRTASGIVIGNTSGLTILPSTSYTRTPALGQTISMENCCELNWQCNSDQDWAQGDRAFQNNFQCALPGRVISIVGDPDFVDFFTQRLDQLRNRLPHRYDYVLSGLDKIQQESADLLFGYVGRTGRTFFVPRSGPSVNGWDTRMSAVLVHEACHIHRHAAGYTYGGTCDREGLIREEVFCREMELEVVIELDAPPDVTEWVRGMVARTHEEIGIAPISEGRC